MPARRVFAPSAAAVQGDRKIRVANSMPDIPEVNSMLEDLVLSKARNKWDYIKTQLVAEAAKKVALFSVCF